MALSRVRRATAACLLLACSLGAPAAGASPSDTVWGCFPGATPNPCEGSLETTVMASTAFAPRRVARVETPAPDANRDVDCFYVYPTVASNPGVNAPKAMTADVRAILGEQAARFSQVCRVYAPVYRQATTAALAAQLLYGSATAAPWMRTGLAVAYDDVLAAWRDYLAHHNAGRGVVLLGHSQGSALLTRLLRSEIDPDPARRALLVSALIPGGNFSVRRGERAGGDLRHIPTCAAAGETGCVVAFSSFGRLPPRTASYGIARGRLRDGVGLPISGDLEAACVNPAELSGDGGRLRTILSTDALAGSSGLVHPHGLFGLAPRTRTAWVVPGERYTGACTRHDGAHVLRIRPARAGTIVPNALPFPDWGLHVADVDLALGNLVDIVRLQREAHLAVR